MKKIIYTVVCMFLCCIFLLGAVSSEKTKKRVLVVHSYHSGYDWTATVSQGIRRIFAGEKNIQVETFYMDTKRKTSEALKEKAGEEARYIIEVWQPHILILVDDNAQEYVGKFYLNKKTPYIVFCGVNNRAEDYGYDKADNVTGILERPHFKRTVEFFREIQPNAQKFAVMAEDSISSKGTLRAMAEAAENTEGEFVGFDRVKSFEEWKIKAKEYEGSVDAIIVGSYQTIRNGDSVKPGEIIKWMKDNLKIPVLGMNGFNIDDGALCGVVKSPLEHGIEAAKIAKNLLEGESIDKFPIKMAEKGLVIVDVDQAAKKGFVVSKEVRKKINVVVS